MKIMAEQAEYMSSLIEKLLSLSKIELNQNQHPEDKVDVTDIVNEVVEALSLKAGEREMKIRLLKDETLPPVIGDRAQIKQVVQNLTDNAVKYGLSGTDITIHLKNVDSIPLSKSFKVADGAAVAISVNNKGPKIEPDKLARLTERFYRCQEHKDLNVKGTGLGLAIAKHIMLRHRGNLTVNSNGYNGTTFTIYLPVEK